MTASLWALIAFVIASTIIAILPMRWQRRVGAPLFFGAPLLIIWIWVDFGLIAGLGVTLAYLSMYRYPLRWVAGQFVRLFKKDAT